LILTSSLLDSTGIIEDLAITDKDLVILVREACKNTQLLTKGVREKVILNKKLGVEMRRKNGYILFRLVRGKCISILILNGNY